MMLKSLQKGAINTTTRGKSRFDFCAKASQQRRLAIAPALRHYSAVRFDRDDTVESKYHESENNLEDSEVTCMMLHPVAYPK